MELKVEGPQQTETKPKEIPVPREISQLIGMGLRQQYSDTTSRIGKNIESLNANLMFAEKTDRMQVALNQITAFLQNLEEREIRLVEIRTDVYDPKFAGEQENLDLKPGRQTLEDPIVPKLMKSIFHALRNPLFILSARAAQIPKDNDYAISILRDCDQIGNNLSLFQNAEGIEVEVDEKMGVMLIPPPKSPTFPSTHTGKY